VPGENRCIPWASPFRPESPRARDFTLERRDFRTWDRRLLWAVWRWAMACAFLPDRQPAVCASTVYLVDGTGFFFFQARFRPRARGVPRGGLLSSTQRRSCALGLALLFRRALLELTGTSGCLDKLESAPGRGGTLASDQLILPSRRAAALLCRLGRHPARARLAGSGGRRIPGQPHPRGLARGGSGRSSARAFGVVWTSGRGRHGVEDHRSRLGMAVQRLVQTAQQDGKRPVGCIRGRAAAAAGPAPKCCCSGSPAPVP